jgi:tight adherence protein C
MIAILCLLLAAICIGVAVVAGVHAAGARRRAVVERLESMIEVGLNASSETDVSAYLEPEQRQSLLSGLATWLGGLAAGRFTAVSEDAIREQLIAAGMYTASPRTVLGYRMLGTVGLPALMFAAVRFHSMLDVLLVLLAAFSGWVLPMTYVSRKARKRTESIDRSLPDLIDLLCVMIEAGLSFTAAMRQASSQFGPPLGDELRLTLQEQTMGLSIDEALAHMAERADTPAMRAFVRAMAQGERMGISIGQIMRSLSHEMRHRRRAHAEERAQKTPILILFPLVFLIFPAMFIMIMTPAVISLIHNLKNF